jgi:uncharacterized protein (TIGR00295 family)
LKIPSGEEAVCIMKRAGCGQPIIEHCIGVTRIALELAEELRRRGMEIDMRLVEAGAMLHDIGRCRTHSVEHGAIGGQMAREMGLPEPLARIIERHVGGGITPEEAERLGLVRGNYIPETLGGEGRGLRGQAHRGGQEDPHRGDHKKIRRGAWSRAPSDREAEGPTRGDAEAHNLGGLQIAAETRAGRLAWSGRCPYEAEVAGSSPARPTYLKHPSN